MGRFNDFKYDATTSGTVYGEAPRLGDSVAPFTASVLDYSDVLLKWAIPSSVVSGSLRLSQLRLVRNQYGFSETPEDGVVLLDQAATLTQPFTTSSYEDDLTSSAIPLVPGRFAFYTIWLRNATTAVWKVGGSVFVVIPSSHGSVLSVNDSILPSTSTHEKVMDLLPRVYTTASQQPLDEIDPTSDLYNFLYGFSFTLDEWLTLVDLLTPDQSGVSSNSDIVRLQEDNFGLTPEPGLALKHRKRLIRNAINTYATKGTASSVGNFIESLTGFAPEVSVSPNMLLTVQDSTFYNGVGSWKTYGTCTLSLEDGVRTPDATNEPKAVDFFYCGKVVATVANSSIRNGRENPVTLGVPVTAASSYKLYWWAKTASSTVSVLPKIHWYKADGTFLSSSGTTSTDTKTTTDSWTKFTFTATAPTNAVFAAIEFIFESTGTLYLDMIQMSLSSETTFQEARAVNVFLLPTNTNELLDPSFEATDVEDEWTITAGSFTRPSQTTLTNVAAGAKQLNVVPSSGFTVTASTIAGIKKDSYYTFSVYAKVASGTPSVDISFSVTDGTTTVSATKTETLSTAWKRISVTKYVDGIAGTATGTVTITSAATSGTFSLDAAQFEASYTPTDFFGAFGGYADSGVFWEGTVNASRTHYYPELILKSTRLQERILDVMPLNRAFRITSYANIINQGFTS